MTYNYDLQVILKTMCNKIGVINTPLYILDSNSGYGMVRSTLLAFIINVLHGRN